MTFNKNNILNTASYFTETVFQAFYATQFLLVWMHPEKCSVSLVNDLSILIIFEFIMVHSGVFMSGLPKNISLYVFVPFYGIFAFGFNASVIDTNIFYIYLSTVLSRMLFAFADVSDEIRMQQLGKSAIKCTFYFFLMFAVALGHFFIPKLGLTQEYLQNSNYFSIVKSSGLFIEKPYIPMCMGFLYYLIPVLYFFYVVYKNITATKEQIIG